MKRLSLLAFTILLSSCHQSRSDAETPLAAPSETNRSRIPVLTECYQGDEWTCAVEAAIIAKTNAKRSTGLLTSSFETSYVARHWSSQQLATDTLSHDGFPQERNATLEAAFPDLDFFFTAENVAMTMSNAATVDALAEEIVGMWWNSSGHRQNMLGPYRYIGVGVARMGRTVYATQLFH